MFNLLKSCFFSPFFNFLDIIKYYLNRFCFFPIKKSYYVYRKEGSMRDKVVDSLIVSIKNKNNFDNVKLEEIRYGFLGLYTLITKTTVIILLSLILGFFKQFIIFFLFYTLLRSVGFGAHAKTNMQCWLFSTLLLIGLPYLITKINFSTNTIFIVWVICFINFLIFAPADTEKRPMISKKRKMIFKIIILLLSLLYLSLLIKFNNISNLILASIILEGILINPIGYILMGQKVRFKLNDINLFKQR